MIEGLILLCVGYSIWKKLQEDPARARREAINRIRSFQDQERSDSHGNRTVRQSGRTQVRQAQVMMINTMEHAQRRVHAQLKRERRQIRLMRQEPGQPLRRISS